MRTKIVLLTLGAMLAALLVATGARATYPGASGRLAFGMDVGGNVDVYSIWPNGEALRRLTTSPGFDACAAYSADGKEITWCGGIVTGPGTGTVEIWKMKQNGKD